MRAQEGLNGTKKTDQFTQFPGSRKEHVMGDDKLKVLVVDDEITRDLMDQLLEDEYTVVGANTGDQGLEMASAERPGLILTELTLLGMSGWDMVAQIRKLEGFQDVPIIAITAAGMPDDEERAMEAGCNDFILKPVDEDELKERIRQVLGN